MQLTFKYVTDENSEIFHILMKNYAKELDKHQNRITDTAVLDKWTDSIISKSNDDTFRILRLCCIDDEAIGFLFAKIDQANDKGYKRTGQGYIMEFYVKPEYRRRGYGKIMLTHIEQFYRERGVAQKYLTADPVSGNPFWSALGFVSKGECSPDNGQEIYEKALREENFDVLETFVHEFDCKYDFAVTTTFCPAIDLNGNELNDIYSKNPERLKPLFLTFLPTQNNSYLICSILKCDVSVMKRYIEQIKGLDEEILKNYINNVIPMYSENIVLSPRLWDKWTRFSRREFDKVLAGAIGDFDKILKNEIPFSSYEDFLTGIKVQSGLLDVLEKTKYNLFKL